MKSPRENWSEAYPAHTCADLPILPCPACSKWTGDGFATVKSNPQCFPGINRNAAPQAIKYEESGYAVMVRVRLVDGWSWTTWMRCDSYKEAAAHLREGQKIVPFGSVQWTAMWNERSPECRSSTAIMRITFQLSRSHMPSGELETLPAITFVIL
jgi:hypothetical protein